MLDTTIAVGFWQNCFFIFIKMFRKLYLPCATSWKQLLDGKNTQFFNFSCRRLYTFPYKMKKEERFNSPWSGSGSTVHGLGAVQQSMVWERFNSLWSGSGSTVHGLGAVQQTTDCWTAPRPWTVEPLPDHGLLNRSQTMDCWTAPRPQTVEPLPVRGGQISPTLVNRMADAFNQLQFFCK